MESFKLIYRQLARKLHPDMNPDASDEEWRGKMWRRAQGAYENKDALELSKIFHLVLLRRRELDSLRVSDLQLTREWLEDEVAQTETQLRELKRQPAWGFSRRKDTTSVVRKLARQMNQQEHAIRDQISELRLQHERLTSLG